MGWISCHVLKLGDLLTLLRANSTNIDEVTACLQVVSLNCERYETSSSSVGLNEPVEDELVELPTHMLWIQVGKPILVAN